MYHYCTVYLKTEKGKICNYSRSGYTYQKAGKARRKGKKERERD